MFDGTRPNGKWRFFVLDDIVANGTGGFLIGAPEIELTLAAAPTCKGIPATVELARGEQPTGKDDVIVGTSGPDTINGGRGNDTVCGLGSGDELRGGTGNDALDGGDGSDTCIGGTGTDTATTCEVVRSVP